MNETILLVEDEALIAMTEAKMLKNHGYEVLTAYNAAAAIETARNDTIDLILMDIDLGPGKMDGTEAAEIILKEKDIPIVFLSSHTEPEIVERTEKITAYGYVVKNTGETVLLNSIKMAFRLFDAKKESQRNERMLMTALDNSQAGIAIADAPGGKLRYVNDAGLLIRGGERKKAVNGVGVDQYVSSWHIKDLDGRPLETDEVPLARAILYGETNNKQFIIEREDHEDRIVMANAAPVLDEQGKVESAIVIFLDVTENKQTEKALVHKNELLKRTEHIARIGGWEWDITTDTVTWSEELYAITGLDPGKPPPQFNEDHYKIYTKESWDKLTAAVDHTLKSGEPYEINARIVRPNTEIRDVSIYGGAQFAADGSLIGLFGIVQDITNKLQLEEKLRKSEEDLRTTLHSIGDAVISTDLQGRVVRMNPVAEKLTGWDFSIAEGRKLDEVFRIVNAETGEKCSDPTRRVIETGHIVGLANHTKLISKGGKEYQIADSASPIKDDEGTTRGVVLVFRDVTEEYAIRRSLRKNEKRLSFLFQSMTEGVCLHELVYDDSGEAVNYRIVDVNPAYEEILTVEKSAVIGKLATEVYHSHLPPYLDTYTEVTKTMEPYRFETYFPPLYKHFLISAFSTSKDSFATVFTDITELKSARNQLKKQKDFLEQIAETSPITIIKVDKDGQIVYANTKAEEVLGLEKDLITNRSYHDVQWKIKTFDGEFFPETELPFRKVRETRETVYDVQHAIEWPNGEKKLLSINAAPLFDEEDEFDGMVASIMDITERYRTERNLRKALEEKDFLMKEMNHRVKNNLEMIKGLIHLKNYSLSDKTSLSDIAGQIDAILIVHEKLYQGEKILRIDIREYIQELLSTIFSFSPKHVEIQNNIQNVSIQTRSAMQIGLIVNEIATNAVKHGFTNDRAKFTVDLEENATRNEYVLVLSNTGKPFPKKINFDNPTTLGLQLISALVDQLEGTIELQKEPHPLFIIRFPMRED